MTLLCRDTETNKPNDIISLFQSDFQVSSFSKSDLLVAQGFMKNC